MSGCWTNANPCADGRDHAAKAWEGYLRERAEPHGRIARTVLLKLKTRDFRILTRSLTTPEPPDSLERVVETACALRERVDLPSRTRYRQVGVGLSGFVDADALPGQHELFA